jgi:hypothetical protein
MTKTRFYSIEKLPFIIRAILEFLFSLSMWNIIFPLSVIFVTLKRIMIYT